MANSLAAAPKKETVEKSLTDLYRQDKTGNRLKVINCNLGDEKFIIFSDQHKGNKSWADDFDICEKNFLAALSHYNGNGYTFINLGDCEELWKFKVTEITPAHKEVFASENLFQPGRYIRTFGNHDIIWKNKLDVDILLKNVFSFPLPVYEGIVISNKDPDNILDIFLTHGHQGDLMSDNNALSTWIVAHIWMPLQRYLRINVNSASNDHNLRNKHNKIMYEWSSKEKNLILITGHTHQPVFASGKYFDHPSNNITPAPQEFIKPSYFNTGCCCFNDGDITGIEISEGFIRLIKWYDEEVSSKKMVLEEIKISELIKDLL